MAAKKQLQSTVVESHSIDAVTRRDRRRADAKRAAEKNKNVKVRAQIHS